MFCLEVAADVLNFVQCLTVILLRLSFLYLASCNAGIFLMKCSAGIIVNEFASVNNNYNSNSTVSKRKG